MDIKIKPKQTNKRDTVKVLVCMLIQANYQLTLSKYTNIPAKLKYTSRKPVLSETSVGVMLKKLSREQKTQHFKVLFQLCPADAWWAKLFKVWRSLTAHAWLLFTTPWPSSSTQPTTDQQFSVRTLLYFTERDFNITASVNRDLSLSCLQISSSSCFLLSVSATHREKSAPLCLHDSWPNCFILFPLPSFPQWMNRMNKKNDEMMQHCTHPIYIYILIYLF